MAYENESLKNLIIKFSAYGQEKNGAVSRTFGSDSYIKAANALQEYMDMCGMESYIDSVGNVHGIYKKADGEMAAKKELLIGSHLDTVKEGGMFDGLLGVLAGVQCVKRIQREQRSLNCNLHIVATNGEEGNDLGGTFGSRCMMGQVELTPQFLEKAKKYGLEKEDIELAKMDFQSVCGYLELHIEQGKTLEETGDEIGVVTGIVGLQRYEILIQGESNHAGTTMMKYRKDALVKAAEIIRYGDSLARELGHNLVATFSKVEILPNVIAVINHQVKMILEFRNQDEAILEKYIATMQKQFSGVQGGDGIRVTFSPIVKKQPVHCNEKIIQAADRVCSRQNIPYRKMPSGATHDGNMMALNVPIGMLFVPSHGGVSHSRHEWTDWEQCELGAEVLYQTVIELSEESKGGCGE